MKLCTLEFNVNIKRKKKYFFLQIKFTHSGSGPVYLTGYFREVEGFSDEEMSEDEADALEDASDSDDEEGPLPSFMIYTFNDRL